MHTHCYTQTHSARQQECRGRGKAGTGAGRQAGNMYMHVDLYRNYFDGGSLFSLNNNSNKYAAISTYTQTQTYAYGICVCVCVSETKMR